MSISINIVVFLGLIAGFVVLLSLGVLLFSADIVFWYKAKRIRMAEKKHVIPCNNVDEFKSKLVSASVYMINKEQKPEFPTITGDTFFKRAVTFWRGKDAADIFNLDWSECGWLFYALAESNYDLNYIKKVFDLKLKNSQLEIVDQCPGGMVAIILYKQTKVLVYKEYADRLYQWLLERDTEHGILYRANLNFQLVDVLGMVVPYLVLYGNTFNVQKAKEIAYKTFELFVHYGCDHSTGMPSFEYCIRFPYLKSGACDWGRGIAWFIIGLSYLDYNKLNSDVQSIVRHLNSSLISIWNKQHSFGHFIAHEGRDLSAELPILYYLFKNKQIKIDENQLLGYSAFCHKGLMYHSSSSNHGLVSYGLPWGYNSLSQAYMLRLINSFQTKRNS